MLWIKESVSIWRTAGFLFILSVSAAMQTWNYSRIAEGLSYDGLRWWWFLPILTAFMFPMTAKRDGVILAWVIWAVGLFVIWFTFNHILFEIVRLPSHRMNYAYAFEQGLLPLWTIVFFVIGISRNRMALNVRPDDQDL